jgi:hypothetical protein
MNDLSRSNLPIPHREHVGLTTYDAKDPDTSYPAIERLRPPEGAPNAVVIMIDDAGFGSSSAFGGPCNTPVANRLGANGLRTELAPLTSDLELPDVHPTEMRKKK